MNDAAFKLHFRMIRSVFEVCIATCHYLLYLHVVKCVCFYVLVTIIKCLSSGSRVDSWKSFGGEEPTKERTQAFARHFTYGPLDHGNS